MPVLAAAATRAPSPAASGNASTIRARAVTAALAAATTSAGKKPSDAVSASKKVSAPEAEFQAQKLFSSMAINYDE
jgi:hypothetical protein